MICLYVRVHFEFMRELIERERAENSSYNIALRMHIGDLEEK